MMKNFFVIINKTKNHICINVPKPKLMKFDAGNTSSDNLTVMIKPLEGHQYVPDDIGYENLSKLEDGGYIQILWEELMTVPINGSVRGRPRRPIQQVSRWDILDI